MDLQTSKLELIKLVVNIDNQKAIEKLIKVLKSEEEDFWLELSDQERQEINHGISLLESGKRISLDDFLKKVS
jgi:hypothetical protein